MAMNKEQVSKKDTSGDGDLFSMLFGGCEYQVLIESILVNIKN